jgi:hypothetical protein
VGVNNFLFNLVACFVPQKASHSKVKSLPEKYKYKERSYHKQLPGKLIVPQLVKEFTVCYGTQRFIAVLTTARHRTLSCAS